MTDVLALEQLFNDVKADFLENGATTNIVFGAKEVTKQINQGPGRANRIVFVPGRYPDGDLGEFTAPRNPGRSPRSVATIREIFSVLIWAYDGTAANDEFAQYKAVRLLLDDWYGAVYRATHSSADGDDAAPSCGLVYVGKPRRVTTKYERRFGEEIQVDCTIDAMVPDAMSASTPVDPPIDKAVTAQFVTSLS